MEINGRRMGAQKRENPVISDWVRVSGGSTEGSLGGWLAQRQAALREVMAAGHLQPLRWVFGACRFLFRAGCVPQEGFFGISERLNLGGVRLEPGRREYLKTNRKVPLG